MNSVGARGVEARGQPVRGDLEDVLADARGVGVVGGEGVPVHHDEEALVLVLQPHPVVEGAGQVAEVQRPRGPHAGEDAGTGHAGRGGRASEITQLVIGPST